MEKSYTGAEALALLALMDAEKVCQVYSGSPGCCCGCQGKHTHPATLPAKKAALARMAKRVTGGEELLVALEPFGGEVHVATCSATRTNIVYFKVA